MSKSPEKLLREILNKDPENLSCFECAKTPVTFVNLISWSFCCQTCSGIIYQFGRVKSINSATFAPNELEFLQSIGGNRNAKLIWMHNTPKGVFPVKDMINWKYKDKKWYNPDVIEEIKRISKPVIGSSVIVDSFEAPTMSRRTRRVTDDSSGSQVSELFSPTSGTIKRSVAVIQEAPAISPRQQSLVNQTLDLNDLFNTNNGAINRTESISHSSPAMPSRQQSPITQQPVKDFFGISSPIAGTRSILNVQTPPAMPPKHQSSTNTPSPMTNQAQFQDLVSDFSSSAPSKSPIESSYITSNFIANNSNTSANSSITPKQQLVDDFFTFDTSTPQNNKLIAAQASNPFVINESTTNDIYSQQAAMVNSKSMENFLNDTFVKS